MVSLLLLFALALPVVALPSGSAAAADIFGQTCDSGQKIANTDVCKDVKTQESTPDDNPIIKIMSSAVNIISFVIGIAAIIGIIVSGIRFMTANGDSGAVAAARTSLVYSLIGVAVAALAQVIMRIVVSII
jgi:hypothetical protein